MKKRPVAAKKPHFRRPSRTMIMIASMTLAGLLLAIYGLLSAKNWSSYHQSYVNSTNVIKKQIDAALATPVTAANQAARLSALDASVRSMENFGSYCHSLAIYDWQWVIIPTVKTWQNECDARSNGFTVLAAQITRIVTYTKNEQGLQTIISKPLAATSVSETNVASQATAWHSAASQLDTFATVGYFSPVKQKAIAVVAPIAAAWDAVVDASKQQNKQAYENAVGALQGVYGGIQGISDQNKAVFAVLTSALQHAYQSAF